MAKIKLWLCLALLSICACAEIPSSDLPLEARNIDFDLSEEEDVISTSYVLPQQIFNDGKAYYPSKDPISGQLDFSSKKPAGIETAANEVIDPKEKIVLNNNSPNIHDYLNLPVKYSSSKFVYPLVSSSYANLKYQGSNKNYITNKKPTSVVASVTPTPDYHSQNNYYTVPTTKLMAVPPTAPGLFTSSSTSSTTTTTTTTTTKQPTTTSTTTTTSTRPPRPTTTFTSAVPPKYIPSTRRPIPLSSTTFVPQTSISSSVSSTRKKFIPTKKYTPTSTSTSAGSTTPMRFPDERANSTTAIPKPTTTTVFTTRHPVPHYSVSSSSSSSTPSTSQPIHFTEDPTAAPAFSPIPGSTRIPNLSPADVYQTLGQKNTEQRIEQKPSMTLADIFNSLAEEESAVASQNQGNQGFDAQGNLIQPISLSEPSPFAMQNQRPTRPNYPTTPTVSLTQPQQQQQQQQYLYDQKVISGSGENYSNEYVSYQVQQPNVMQYRPIPGAINNVVISPGQNSASFVLGSQQQVGANAFGTVAKEPLFSQQPPVQYGTVINEDIGGLQRPAVGPTQQTAPPAPPTPYQQTPAHGNSNFHQNGNFGNVPADPSPPYVQRPLAGGTTAPNSDYQPEEPPAPPSPYQQLPLIGTRPRPQTQQHSVPQQQGNVQQQSNVQQQGNPQLQASAPNQEGPQQPHSAYPQQPGFPTQLHQQGNQEENRYPANTEAAAQDTKELLVSTNIRFPANEEQSEEVPSVPVSAGPPTRPQINGQVNGHAQPLSLQQIQNSNQVVFPNNKDEEGNAGAHYAEHGNVGDIQIQQHEVVTMNQHKQQLNFPPQSSPDQQLAPSTHMEPPPRPQQQNRPHGPPQFAYNEYTRKPLAGISRPNPERHLPNILPQFRPNAKVSGGHPPPNFNQEPGNIRIQGGPLQSQKRPNPSPQFSHRRQPLMQQKRYPLNRNADFQGGPPPPPPAGDANRRVYRLPPYGGQGVQYLDRMYARRPGPRPAGDGSYVVERHGAASSPEVYKTMPQPQALISPDRMAAFEEEDLVINDPPQPITPNQEQKPVDETKLEPVVTLQMLQSQKKPVTLSSDDSGSGEIQVPGGPDNGEPGSSADSQNGLYVVYPMKGENQQSETDNGKDNLPALAHIEPPTGSDYQNTPFSVVRDQPQEPILMVKNKKPQSLQQQTKSQSPKDKFPYPIEKPDPSFSELNAPKRVPGVLIAPRIINGGYVTGTAAPIAIAYTPTEPNAYRNAQKYSNVNLASSVISEIRTDTQTEEGLSNDFDLRGQNLEKNFMAPFYPSVSLGSATNAPSNGWNILPSTTDKSPAVYEKNNINRADVAADEHEDNDDEPVTTMRNFEMDKFQPELQGGFKPIYPPGYKIEDEEEEHLQQHESNNMPLALASHMEPLSKNAATISSSSSTSTTSTSTSTTSTTTSTTTPKPPNSSTSKTAGASTTSKPATLTTTAAPASAAADTKNKKPGFETSLAALLFGDDEDFEERDEARKEQPTRAKSGPRSAPRMGPRNIKMS